MRFQYSLQKIVDLKSNEKSQAEWYLSDAVGRLQQEEQSLATLHSEKEQLQENVMQTSTGSTTVQELMQYQMYMNHLNRRISSKTTDVMTAQRQVDRQKEVLTDKMMEEKVWLKARERALDIHLHAVNRKEQEALDEMATNRYKYSG